MSVELKVFFKGFVQRSGPGILVSTVLARGLTFFASWLALKLLPGDTLGLILFAVSILAFFIPFAGFGASQGLLRYGALRGGCKRKRPFFYKAGKKRTCLFLYDYGVHSGFCRIFHAVTGRG
ncbi:MAG: hypothetical protein U5K51_12285 [Flavobacteriaceae bacterium]|nr:hypothetical protein [Flavobacteriaceae bacterium]